MIALNDNGFVGGVPKELGRLSMLKRLYIYRNQLDGTIPKELGDCRSAIEIDFSENRLAGTIPGELGRIQTLRLLHLFENRLQGRIPPELGRLSLLRRIDLSINNLTGTIPLEFDNLTSLEYLQLFNNNLYGAIPPMLGANSNLSVLDLSDNRLSGSIPSHLCEDQKLIFLSLGSNELVGNIPRGVKTCKSLVQLRLGGNLLTGSLPIELSALQNLSALEMDQNRFSGPIPPEIGKFKSIERLLLSNNYFLGQLPPEIGELTELVSFNISSNQLSGPIPRELANCTKLQRLDLSRNRFSGFVPVEIGNLVNLELLKLSGNNLNGSIPSSLRSLFRLTELQMGGNRFSGHIPVELGQLTALQIALNLSYNSLDGEIPTQLGNLHLLEFLYLNDNQLEGEVPASFSELSSLLVCNLSYNNLVGSLPNIPLFQKLDNSNFLGNIGLCGMRTKPCEPISLPSSNSPAIWAKKDASREKIVSIASFVVGIVSLFLTAAVCWSLKRRTPNLPSNEDRKQNVSGPYYLLKEQITYQELLEATGNFSESAVIGRGACGTVYKAVMYDGSLIAVKKIKAQGEGSNIDSSFRAEISTLGNVRHRNIVKLYGFCSYQDSNLILYEYMANGSLGKLLHGDKEVCMLDWDARYRIALGAAEGLRYLHCDCKPQIVHRDIKSNNILLDEAMEAHVGDFGLAKLIDISHSKTMSAVAGSYGYIAPEYAFTMKVTEKCDIYSLGVILLELVTGQPPIQPLEKGGDLVNWVRRLMQNAAPQSEIFDSRLDLSSKSTIEEMSLVLKIALFCTSESPLDRPTMREVISMLVDARVSSSSDIPSSPTSETAFDEETTSFKG
ncbi:leucine-rich repeat receptor-like serine/threonine-protein kinase At1g17230 isoform X1 [Ananas comosus]|nr:leucine-rich repeat receptor-like serine/threonine-protein kinase At1g17230 isoform X1 [Ananas comosus]